MQAGRRTHEERSTETRQRLVTATLDCLIDDGYVNTTMHKIAERAGLSRGAQTHHFPAKVDLIVAATEHLFNEFAENIDELARARRDGGSTLEAFIDQIWERFFSGRFMYASLELIVASRSDQDLHDRLVPLIKNLHTSLDKTWLTFFKGNDAAIGRSDVLLNLTLCLFRGMVVQSVLRTDPQYYADLLSTWKRIIPMFVSEPVEPLLSMVPADVYQKDQKLN
ncbi:MAG: TetR/AcrR family transcriptional regulator [Rhodospirillales bacterium]